RGLERFRNVDVVIIDTSGRHKEEKSLMVEMKMLAGAINPDEIILVLDGTIGQQASAQAEAFNAATKIGSIFIAKLDGSARGGGALSSVAATGAPIKFIGTGERPEDIEPFDPPRFVGSLLGMGDIESLVRKVREAEIETSEKDLQAFLSGRFTLTDMYQQFESMRKMGPLQKVLSMLPGLGYSLPKDQFEVAEKKMDRWRAIIQSMTVEERENPQILNASRRRRIARGSGTEEAEVRELIKQFNAMKKMFKSLRGKRGLLGRLPLNFRRI
ncbi:MAG: signal recognition particle protein Srp19, partial [Candidatus Bathyarchaeia archaeon]